MWKAVASRAAAIALAGIGALLAQPIPDGGEFQVNTMTVGFTLFPDVAKHGAGEFMVVWRGGSDQILGRRYDSSASPEADPFAVSGIGAQRPPSVDSNAAGETVVVWAESDGSLRGVVGQRYDPLGVAVGSQFAVNTYTTDQQEDPSVAVADFGGFVVVWRSREQDGSAESIFGQRFDSAGDPSGEEFQVNALTLGSQYHPHVATDRSSGAFVVVWSSYTGPGAGAGVIGRDFGPGGVPDGGEFPVTGPVSGYAQRARAAMDDQGRFVVVWSLPGFVDSYDVYARRFDPDGPKGGAFRVNTFAADYQIRPDVGFGDQGRFVVLWQSEGQDGSGYGVFGQELEFRTAATLGSEFQISSSTIKRQFQPSISMNPPGDFVVTWISDHPAGGAEYVQGQSFLPCSPVPGEVSGVALEVDPLARCGWRKWELTPCL